MSTQKAMLELLLRRQQADEGALQGIVNSLVALREQVVVLTIKAGELKARLQSYEEFKREILDELDPDRAAGDSAGGDDSALLVEDGGSG